MRLAQALRHDVRMPSRRATKLSPFSLLCVVAFLSACPDGGQINQTGEGCSFDSDCAAGEICTSFGECRPDTSEPDSTAPDTPSPDTPSPETPTPGTPTPETPTPETPTPDVDAGGEPDTPTPDTPTPDTPTPDTPTPDTPTPDVDAGSEPEGEADAGRDVDAGAVDAGSPEPEPECESDGDCANGLTCISETCVVGCDGVPAAGTCTPTEFAFCANPGQGNEEIRTLSLAQPVCFNELLIETCSATGNPEGIDCIGAGGDCSQGACIALPEGSPCNDDTLVCGNDADGTPLLCADKNAQGVGTCQSGCGDIDAFGECTDGVVTFCQDEGTATERLESYDCFAFETCGTLRPGIEGCVAAQGLGDQCWNQGQNLGSCGSSQGDLACQIDLDTGNGECVANTSTCTPEEKRCTGGNLLMASCYQTQPLLIWCGDHGATCQNDVTPDGAACVNVQFGEVCNNIDLFCRNGLGCFNGFCQ